MGHSGGIDHPGGVPRRSEAAETYYEIPWTARVAGLCF
jgi:hypothetical protein